MKHLPDVESDGALHHDSRFMTAQALRFIQDTLEEVCDGPIEIDVFEFERLVMLARLKNMFQMTGCQKAH